MPRNLVLTSTISAAASAVLVISAAHGAIAAPATVQATAQPVDVFIRDTKSPLAGQDQLAAALSASTKQGHALRIAHDAIRLYRTFWLPAGANLQLAPESSLFGFVSGQSLVRLQSGSTLSGGTVRNTATDDCFDVDVASGTTGATIDGVAFEGTRTNSVYVNAPDVQNLTVRNSTFTDTHFGVLINRGAVRTRRVLIDGNTFTRTTADAVEINTPAANIADATRDVIVSNNTVNDMRGSGDGTGFAVGVAGVQGFQVVGNRLLGVRNEGVHIEDHARSGIVRGNLVSGGGTGGRPAVAIYRTSDDVRVQGNVVQRFAGGGIAVLWDSIGSSTRIAASKNLVQDVTGDGIVMGGDAGTGPFDTTSNAVLRSQNGIVSYGTHERDSVTANLTRDVRGTPILSAYQGAAKRSVSGNTSSPTVTVESVVGADVVALSAQGAGVKTAQHGRSRS